MNKKEIHSAIARYYIDVIDESRYDKDSYYEILEYLGVEEEDLNADEVYSYSKEILDQVVALLKSYVK